MYPAGRIVKSFPNWSYGGERLAGGSAKNPNGVLPSLRESDCPVGLRAVSVSPLAEPLRGSCALSIVHSQGSRSRGNPGLYGVTPSAYSKSAQRDKNRTVINTESSERCSNQSDLPPKGSSVSSSPHRPSLCVLCALCGKKSF